MNVSPFLDSLNKATYNDKAIVSVYREFVTKVTDDSIDAQAVTRYFGDLQEESFTEIESKLGRCLEECRRELENIKFVSDEYKIRLNYTDNILSNLLLLYRQKYSQRTKKTDSVSSALDQHDDKLVEINTKIIALEGKVEQANSSIDNKAFTLLINTVAILGIFVAIAFTGFGVTAIFPQIDINNAMLCEEYLVKTIFFLLLVSLICYNLLLLLVYLIFKLSRPIFISLRKEKEGSQKELEIIKEGQFIKTVNLAPFLWIDIGLALLTAITFIIIIQIW